MYPVGCHLSDRNGFMGMAYEASGLSANTFQFFTRNPRGGRSKAWDPKDVLEFNDYRKEKDFAPIVAYAPYTANPAAEVMKEQDFAKLVMSEDLGRMEAIPGQYYAIHPGSAVDETSTEALKNFHDSVNEVLTANQSTTMLFILMPGSGKELGSSFKAMEALLDGIKLQDHIGVCLDTTAMWGEGLDIVNDLDSVLDQCDSIIGLDRVKAMHLADPKYAIGTHHTNHAALGSGAIGIEGLAKIGSNPRLRDKVMIFETPHDEVSLYGKAIKALRKADGE